MVRREVPIRDPSAWPALAVALALMGLGSLFILQPGWGASLFGLPAPEGAGAAWISVVGVRDLAFGGYVLTLLRFATVRAVGIVLAVTALIPVADVLILLRVHGLDAGWNLLPHLGSFAVTGLAAIWTLRRGP
jgi:hypothetical protein